MYFLRRFLKGRKEKEGRKEGEKAGRQGESRGRKQETWRRGSSSRINMVASQDTPWKEGHSMPDSGLF